MDTRLTILKELQDISPIVEQVGPLNPYFVPSGYFEAFPQRMLELARNATTDQAELKESVDTPFTVPEGYFASFADSMLSKVKAMSQEDPGEELRMLSKALSGLDKKMPFSTPDGYFDEFASNVTDGAKAIEEANKALSTGPSVLPLIREKGTYTVPAAYFENLPSQILSRVSGAQGGTVVKGNFTRKLIRLAVAALIVGVVAVSGLLFFNNQITPDANMAGIEQVPVEELESYVNNQSAMFPEETLSTTISTSDLQAEDVKEFLADFSDTVLQQYVNQYTDVKTDLN